MLTEAEAAKKTKTVLEQHENRNDYMRELMRDRRFVALTARQRAVLETMASEHDAGRYEEAEIVCSGIECWLGHERVSRKTVTALLTWLAIKEDESSRGVYRYTISSIGRNALKDPEIVGRVKLALAKNQRIDDMGNPIK